VFRFIWAGSGRCFRALSSVAAVDCGNFAGSRIWVLEQKNPFASTRSWCQPYRSMRLRCGWHEKLAHAKTQKNGPKMRRNPPRAPRGERAPNPRWPFGRPFFGAPGRDVGRGGHGVAAVGPWRVRWYSGAGLLPGRRRRFGSGRCCDWCCGEGGRVEHGGLPIDTGRQRDSGEESTPWSSTISSGD
jgi:hypothetical protein